MAFKSFPAYRNIETYMPVSVGARRHIWGTLMKWLSCVCVCVCACAIKNAVSHVTSQFSDSFFTTTIYFSISFPLQNARHGCLLGL
jgi:hypothetical protein